VVENLLQEDEQKEGREYPRNLKPNND